MPDPEREFLKAIRRGDLALVDKFLAQDPNCARVRDHSGVSALMLAQYANQPEVVARLLGCYGDLDAFEAAALGLTQQLARLVDQDTGTLNSFSADGFTVLHLAAYFGHVDTVRMLLDRNAPLATKSRNSLGVAPLHSAAAGRHLPVVRLLLAGGANVNDRQNGNWTALHSAAQYGDREIAVELLRNGADRYATNSEDKTPADLARDGRHNEVAAILDDNRGLETINK